MGVPKFYRWISERYPKINQVVTDSALLPEFDHLYLDMNGIIHGCTHPSHMDVSDVLSERDMLLGIMHYLDRIITQIVKPKVSVYMAIDGVAPRAKLNQQRSRRFRSAKDMAEATKDMPDRSSAQVFDSNCITPGTEFMARVSDAIKYFIRKKLKEDPLWKNLKVVFSGHEIPGEGEHKIMQHIREMKAAPGYQANTRHVMYGQDADLIMLGLVTHEPHFTLLREIVKFGMGFGNNESKNSLKTVMRFTKESDFQLLHLSVLREYLEIEFCRDATGVDLERAIDDFNFLTFLVGNDFLPHLQCLDIGDGAFDLIFSAYKRERETWGAGHYLTYLGEISDAKRLESFFCVIGATETEILAAKEEDEAVYTKKRRKWDKRDGKADGPSDAELLAAEDSKQNDYLGMVETILSKYTDKDFVDGWTPVHEAGEKDFKGRYYFEKLKFTPVDKKAHFDLRKAYIEGLQWCLAYYYKGCISWGWFFPYHYGPMLSDLRNLESIFADIKFELGAPLKPFEQLMGCLPPASGILVPTRYRRLMTDPNSPIIQFYPQDFVVDMNGKRNPWEGVNLLPFIDVKLLKDTIAALCPDKLLSADEVKRNSRGKVLLYTHDPTANETFPSPNQKIGLTDIIQCNSKVSSIDAPDRLDICFKPELLPGTLIPYPGFPSLNVLPVEHTELTRVGLNCFGSASKYPNVILFLHKMPELPPVEQMADNIIGKSLYINWPMMHEARVVAISDASCEVRLENKKKIVKKFKEKDAEDWQSESTAMETKYLCGYGLPGSGGLNIGEIQYRLKLLPLQGMRTNQTTGASKKVFGAEEADVPLQVCLWRAPAPDPRFEEHGPLTIADRFPPDCKVVLTKGKLRGCVGTVIGAADDGKNVGVKVQTVSPEPPFGLAIARSVQESYVSSMDAAKLLKLNPGLFGKITGSLFFEPGRYDIGLNLKYTEGLCVVGYSRKAIDSKQQKGKIGIKAAWGAGDSLLVVGSKRMEDSGDENGEKITWQYTPKAIRLVSLYRQKFPQLFSILNNNPNEKKYTANMLGRNGEATLSAIRDWLNNIETAKLPRTPVSTIAMPMEAIQAVQKAADVRTNALKKGERLKDSLIKIPAYALYREGSTNATDVLTAADLNDDEAPELGDRIVNICAMGLPFGARGSIVGIHEASTGCVEVVMDEEFIGGGNLQGACGNFRGKLCIWAHLLKISPSNSDELVDKLVPKGSGKATVESLLASIEKQSVGSHKEKKAPAWGGKGIPEATPEPATEPQKVPTSATKVAPSSNKTPSRSTSRAGSTGRPVSTGRSKQGSWREAKGPDSQGVGFKGKTGKSGLARWKALPLGKSQPPPGPFTSESLKSILGVASNTAISGSNASADLKAMLGVSPSGASVPAIMPPSVAPPVDASSGLKAILGVNPPPLAGPPPPQIGPPQGNPFPPPPIPPSFAADKLFQMMQLNGPPPVSIMHPMLHPQPPSTSFNFTYVEEGKDAPPPAQMQHQRAPPQFNYQTMAMPMPPSATMMMHPMHFIPPPPPFQAPVEAFPPLCSQPLKLPVETSKAHEKPTTPIVPSIVASKVQK